LLSAVAAGGILNKLSWAAGNSDPDVIVLGAGLSGLNAALILEQFGLRVRVLEARERVGGRLHTLDDVPGRPEAGGNTIAAGYARTVDTANRLGVKLQSAATSPLLNDERMLFHIQSRRMTRSEWANAENNPMPALMRALPPDRVLGRILGPSPLRSIGAWREPENFVYDVPVDAELRSKGLSAEALRLMDVNNSYGNTLADTSLLNLYYVQTNFTEMTKIKGPVKNVEGGNQRLPEAMARALRGELLLNRTVVSVQSDERLVSVRCSDGSRHTGRFVICSLPLPALRQVRFEPQLPSRHAEAIQQLAYGCVTQLHLEVLRPFWEAEGVVPYVWSDGPLERIFPNDEKGRGTAESLTIWVNGTGTERWDDVPESDLQRQIDKELIKIFPSSEGAVRLKRRILWQKSPWSGGSWANWRPGQITRYSGAIGQPHGRLHFAGEHTSQTVRGMEGAMESGERAAGEILALI
jgi:monoamine oxidase